MHRTRLPLGLAALLLATAPLPAAAPDDFFFRKGDRVVFLGDSITEQYQYSSTIELYLTTRFPDWDLTFLNAGIGGDTAGGGAGRFRRHVLDEKPTCVTIDFGMNDGGYKEFKPEAAANYVKNTAAMLEAAKKAGVRVALISPNAVEVRGHPHLATYLETQQQFYAPLAQLAEKFGVPFVDQYAVTRKVLERIAADKAPVSPFPDGVHTNGAGGLLMAHTILAGLHAPAAVSELVIDAGTRTSKARGCSLEQLNFTGDGGVSFVRTDRALPLPVARDWRPILPYIDQLRDLNWYGLQVAGLAGGKYTLAIDDQEVGSFTAEELAAGVNLGNLDRGPLFEQGEKVEKAIKAKNDGVHLRFRGLVMFQTPGWMADLKDQVEPRRAAEAARVREKIDGLQVDVYRLAQPAPHKFELKAARQK
jgi:lysophospholipase L1-like esterase